jgi:NAD(P)-dependent dehydrogenase (short-subunit alcohol dehydrogenase family)
MEKLSGKTALVTGSTDGVGRLVARKLGQAGARVLVHGRDAERGAGVVADIEASAGAADFLAADLSALAEVRRLADAAQATVDRLDILINNAGIGTAGPRQTSAEGAILCCVFANADRMSFGESAAAEVPQLSSAGIRHDGPPKPPCGKPDDRQRENSSNRARRLPAIMGARTSIGCFGVSARVSVTTRFL